MSCHKLPTFPLAVYLHLSATVARTINRSLSSDVPTTNMHGTQSQILAISAMIETYSFYMTAGVVTAFI